MYDDPEVVEHEVRIDRFDVPWFTRAGCGKESRLYAENHNETCLVSAEIQTENGSFRKFTSFIDNQAFLDYYKVCNEKCIPPNTPCLLFTDHDQLGNVSDLRKHNEGVKEVSEVLFSLLGIPQQDPVVLTSHRVKEIGDYVSTHLRFPTVSLESCNQTMKAIHHLLKHSGREYDGLDFGTHACYQQLRVPGCSKAGSNAKLLPADGSPLEEILLASNSGERQYHITTDMALKCTAC